MSDSAQRTETGSSIELVRKLMKISEKSPPVLSVYSRKSKGLKSFWKTWESFTCLHSWLQLTPAFPSLSPSKSPTDDAQQPVETPQEGNSSKWNPWILTVLRWSASEAKLTTELHCQVDNAAQGAFHSFLENLDSPIRFLESDHVSSSVPPPPPNLVRSDDREQHFKKPRYPRTSMEYSPLSLLSGSTHTRSNPR